jgi:Ser/Thr protein kinase RdoA (MazF antagonist)
MNMDYSELNLQIQKLWPMTEDLIFHRNVANDIYFSKINNQEVVVRLTPSSQRSVEEIASELDWINHLKKNSVNVCQTVLSLNNEEIETLNFLSKTYHVVVFKKVNGARLADRSLNLDIVRNWAHNMAKMHNLSENYTPPHGSPKRKFWHEDSAFLKSLEAHNESTEEIKTETLKIISWMKSQPQSKSNFGLIHADLHTGNFFCENNELFIFDFDDSAYHWFLYDLTIPIMSILRDYEGPEFINEKMLFINAFINFYFEKRERPVNWKEDLIKFCKFNCFLTHFWLIAIRKERNLSEKMSQNFDKSILWDGREGLNPELLNLL